MTDKNINSKPRVAIGMSGGDLTAVSPPPYLNERGYEVIGVPMRLWDGV